MAGSRFHASYPDLPGCCCCCSFGAASLSHPRPGGVMQVPAGAAQCSLLAFLEASATFAVIFTSIQSIGQQRVLASAVKHIGGGGGVALQGRGCAWCWLGPLLPLPLQSKMTPFSLEEQSLKC